MIKFPKDVNNKRAFQASWHEKFKWLEYSISKDSVFCFDCRKFGSIHGRSEEQFIKNGYNLLFEKLTEHTQKFRPRYATVSSSKTRNLIKFKMIMIDGDCNQIVTDCQ